MSRTAPERARSPPCASLMGVQEWKARGPAAALAAGLGAPVFDPQALQLLTADRAQDTPDVAGLLGLPRFLRLPAEMDIRRRDLDKVSGVPNRGGTYATIGRVLTRRQVKTPETG